MSGRDDAPVGAPTGPLTRRVALLAAVATLLAACGKKGDVEPPTDRPSEFPRRYPR